MTYDIFKLEPKSLVLWKGVADTLESAKNKAFEFQRHDPAAYMVFCRQSGTKAYIKPEIVQRPSTQRSPRVIRIMIKRISALFVLAQKRVGCAVLDRQAKATLLSSVVQPGLKPQRDLWAKFG